MVLDLLVPPACLICRLPLGARRALCDTCIGAMPRIDPACPRCGLGTPRPGPCGRCVIDPPPFDRVVAGALYEPPLDRMVTALKFRQRLVMAPALAELIEAAIPAAEPLPQCLVPVPLHRRRLLRRGFNQALEIARPLARALHLPIAVPAVRVHATRAQSELSLDRRRANVRRAFVLADDLPYRHVAVVDDVMTSGETAAALTGLLRRAGVARVQVWVAARAP